MRQKNHHEFALVLIHTAINTYDIQQFEDRVSFTTSHTKTFLIKASTQKYRTITGHHIRSDLPFSEIW
jgi:hypothetical protein